MRFIFVLHIVLNTLPIIRCDLDTGALLDVLQEIMVRRSPNLAEEQFDRLVDTVGPVGRSNDTGPLDAPTTSPGKLEINMKSLDTPPSEPDADDSGTILHILEPRKLHNQPGNALLQPENDVLNSAVNFPAKKKKQFDHPLYGNLDNIGLSWKPNEFVLYTGFRKGHADYYMNEIMKAAEKVDKEENKEPKTDVMMLLAGKYVPQDDNDVKVEEVDRDRDDASEDVGEIRGEIRRMSLADSFDGRRKNNVIGPLFGSSSSSSSDSGDSSSSGERDKFHPYTVHKNKYKQNWIWNLEMTGDHMNVNPNAPNMFSGPSSATLFFGRKWWYFHQDDYVPLR